MAINAVSSRSSVRLGATRRRFAVVVNASSESRRAVLGGLAAGVALNASKAAFADATPVDIFDDRKARLAGFDIIYEARDLDIPQSERDGLTQARANLAATRQRVKEAERRIKSTLDQYVAKGYWTEAREQLRGQVGMLRFDLNALASSQPKEQRRATLEARTEFIKAVEAFDLSLREKNKQTATERLAVAKAALNTAVAAAV
mmetsp:Transcript_13906/g.40324  ORF Transcript_13906/g.40324 Transcript_13906/m.40324 type:complete len:203 (-) Transcript_13906:164-772(-)